MTRCPICRKGHIIQLGPLIVCAWCEMAWERWQFLAALDANQVIFEWADSVRLASVGSA